MQVISDELLAILKSHFQVGADGFRARLEVDRPVGDGACAAGDLFEGVVAADYTAGSDGHWTDGTEFSHPAGQFFAPIDQVGDRDIFTEAHWGPDVGGATTYVHWIEVDLGVARAMNWTAIRMQFPGTVKIYGHDAPMPPIDPDRDFADAPFETPISEGWTEIPGSFTPDLIAPGVPALGHMPATGDTGWYLFEVTDAPAPAYRYLALVFEQTLSGLGFINAETVWDWTIGESCVAAAYETRRFQIRRASKDRSLRSASDQLEVVLANEDLPLGWGPTSLFPTNSRCRIFEWYGDAANAVRTFTGLIDKVLDTRDVLTTTLAIRDMFAILIDQTHSAFAPQQADEAGAVRTPANGVYRSMEVSDIVTDLLDRAGWPADARAITPTSYVLDEFIVGDGQSIADAIIGAEQLTGLVGYDAFADEAGVFHFEPSLAVDSLTDPLEPAYTFRAGEDILSLADATDQYELRTRVKIRGPLTTTTLTDTWRELWRTSRFKKPVGLWYAPADPLYIRVLDRGTKRMYKVRQSDRAVVSYVYLGSVVPHPLGLSGDPADATIYWVLNAPWIDGGSGGNSLKKIRKSDNHVLATYALPSGRWSAVKVSSAFIWLTNLDTDRIYKRSKASAAAIASYSHSYAGTVQRNPSGLMIDGTKLHVFWANGGTTARFLVADEAAPGVITKVVKTAGTNLHGGEIDTTTHIHCYGDSDSLGLVAKFTLQAAVDTTKEVFAEVIDSDLEDELGLLAQLEPRIHDSHPDDPEHAYEIRRDTVDLSLITSLAQATETGARRLDLEAQRRRVLDMGIIGNPALQKRDVVAVVDGLTGISSLFSIDTARSEMSDTYLGTLALIPIAPFTDEPDEDDDATDVDDPEPEPEEPEPDPPPDDEPAEAGTGDTITFGRGEVGVLITHDDQVIEDVFIDGPGADIYGSAYGIRTDGGTYTGVIIRRVRVRGADAVGMLLENLPGVLVEDVLVEDSTYAAIMLIGCAGGTVRRPTVKRVGVDQQGTGYPNYNAYGITATMYLDEEPSTDIVIEDGHVEDVPLWHGVDFHGVHGGRIEHMTVIRCARAIYVTSNLEHVEFAQDIVVTRNLTDDPDTVVNGTNPVAITYYEVHGIEVTDNHTGTYGTGVYDYLNLSTGETVSGNAPLESLPA